jgi:hypothetical protein
MAAAMVRRNSSRRRRTAESEEHRSQVDGGYDPYSPGSPAWQRQANGKGKEMRTVIT